MIAVADASPVCYLILIHEIDVLPELFAQVLLPRDVLDEFLVEAAPPEVRSWAATPPAWVSVADAISGLETGLERLQKGEKAAILLAESTRADLVLLDDKSARRTAAERGLKVG
jgi:predicted nucleic acid-binding protein